ncbi:MULTISPECIES: VOC family protein [Streptomyces]|uniref:VOC family protein n=2 Tax=Streptomyces TaxID=1883 RepID=A0ABS9JPW1_9ACTN|nr:MULTISPECIES: VOC family protein [Streptomyces]MYU26780.1 VOC family protein [Streptomyces sp. SID7810]CUW25600.1 Glyoxalase-like domain protein [Streptomyces reticuli]AKN74337.1 extradiol dioxygenase [Streptomyces sp. PBH53]MCG0067546.1 VOC family protein [Streptomyces tricolor]OYP13680.1 VOC family protein [Streptomyces sp. FBKL.4005]
MTLVKAGVVVLDCAEPEKLAEFYRELLEGERTAASANLVEIRGADGVRLAFRRDINATPPSWPRPENSLQVHLDFLVDDLDEAERRVVGLGGRPVDTKDAAGPYEQRVYADPAGHSFTLRLLPGTAPKQG